MSFVDMWNIKVNTHTFKLLNGKMCVQLDLGYPAASYPDTSIIRLRSGSVYCLFFNSFPHEILLKTKTKWMNLFYCILYPLYMNDNLLQVQ